MSPIDAILLSHNHYDHLDIATLKRLHAHSAPLIITPLGNDTTVRQHLAAARLAAGDWGDRFDLGHGAEVMIVPANHWSARGVSDRRMALWVGFFLCAPSGSFYFAGDTAYRSGRIFREIRENCGAPDIALLPIGGYEPHWFMAAQHCDPEEPVRIALDLGSPWLIGMHWGTFNLTDEPCEEPARLLVGPQDVLAWTSSAWRLRSPGNPGTAECPPASRAPRAPNGSSPLRRLS